MSFNAKILKIVVYVRFSKGFLINCNFLVVNTKNKQNKGIPLEINMESLNQYEF